MTIGKLLIWPGVFLLVATKVYAGEYKDRFMQLYGKVHNPSSGYFSPEKGPYHSVETLIVEAPDHGHQSTSEAYSYYLMLEAYYGMATGNWQPLKTAWATIESQIIPRSDMQPTNQFYNSSSPATLAFEFDQPSSYPAALQVGVPVGKDPISQELATAYGDSNVYGMHWLLDLDNVYGYGIKGDGVSKPSYLNTFQRGKQESVWETVPQPSWESFNWGGSNGFLPLFTQDSNYSKQWRYTDAPDADARIVQVMYWVYQWMVQAGKNPSTELPEMFGKTAKMADYLRLAMFDKYFKKIGSQNPQSSGTGYDSAHYLLSWYYAWGGSIDTQNGWAWRIGCSHVHFGYQNPLTAYALTNVPVLKPKSAGGARDWQQSLQRQIEFYTWLQSKEGAIAGGATNSWNGRYESYPAQTPTFYGMAYVEHPVYEDPGSNQWFGWQAWSMERVAEYLYVSKNESVRPMLSKWVQWALSETHIHADGSYEVPSTLKWSGQPYTWNPTSPKVNDGLSVSVLDYTQDIGVTASFAKTLMFFAASDTTSLGTTAKDVAKALLDGVWSHQTDIGLAVPEKRGDYKRFNDSVYIPQGFSGRMASGAAVQPGATFSSLRPFYKNDSAYADLMNALNQGIDPTFTYHRFWAQAEAASAFLQYETLFSGVGPSPSPTVSPSPSPTVSPSPSPTVSPSPSPTVSPSPSPTVTPTPPVGGCQVGVQVNSPWEEPWGSGTYKNVVNIYVKNTGNSAIAAPWTLTLVNSNYTALEQAWNWDARVFGGAVTGSASQSWQSLAPNGGNTINVGMIVSANSTVFMPSSVMLNGQTCTLTVGQ
jgi:hypothetical protein